MERGLLLLGREVRGLEQVEQRDGTSSSAAPSSTGRSLSGRPRRDRPQSAPDGRSSPSVWQDLCEGPPPGAVKKLANRQSALLLTFFLM